MTCRAPCAAAIFHTTPDAERHAYLRRYMFRATFRYAMFVATAACLYLRCMFRRLARILPGSAPFVCFTRWIRCYASHG